MCTKGKIRRSTHNTNFILESEGGNLQINGRFVDAVHGVEGLRGLKDQLSIGHTYYTGELAGT